MVSAEVVDVAGASGRLFTAQVERIRATYTFNSKMFVRGIVQNVREGEPLWRSLENTKAMSDLAVEMIKVGESTGARLPDAMGSRGMGLLLGNDITQFRRTRETPLATAVVEGTEQRPRPSSHTGR